MTFWMGLDYYHWLLLGLLLLVIEVLSGGGFLMWVGFSALGTGVLLLALPWFGVVPSWEMQLIIFAIGCVVAVLAWWKFFHWTVADPGATTLNRRGSELIGREVLLKVPLENGVGHVMIDGVRWQVAGPDLPAGTKVRLLALDDLVFRVEKITL